MTDRELLELLLHKITNMESSQQIMQSDIQTVKSDMQGMQAEMKTMKSDIETIKKEQQRHSDYIYQLIKIVGATNKRVDTMQKTMEELSANLKQFIEEQKSIFEILGEHEVAIRTFRRKPV